MVGRSVLIVGAGIAGPALAYWLAQHGFEATLVERSPHLRTAGYIIDFWGLGYEIVERMGLLPQLASSGYRIQEVRIVNRHGRRRGGFDAEVFRTATQGRYTSLPRGALSAILHSALAGRAEVRFGDTPVELERRSDGVLVKFEQGESRLFDVVVGADGLHSVVREKIFGDLAKFERPLGFHVAAFEVAGYRPRDEGVYVSFGAPGRQIARFSMRDDRTMFLLVAADEDGKHPDAPDAKRFIHSRFDDVGWETPEILAAMDASNDLYFDRVSQVRMPHWFRGAVGLVGDAAYAPSLLAGQGAALAIVGAYVLAGELSRAVTAEGAFERYEKTLRQFIVAKQDAAVKLAGSFAPRSHLGLWARDMATRAFAIPGAAKLLLGNSLVDDLRLPDYAPRVDDSPPASVHAD